MKVGMAATMCPVQNRCARIAIRRVPERHFGDARAGVSAARTGHALSGGAGPNSMTVSRVPRLRSRLLATASCLQYTSGRAQLNEERRSESSIGSRRSSHGSGAQVAGFRGLRVSSRVKSSLARAGGVVRTDGGVVVVPLRTREVTTREHARGVLPMCGVEVPECRTLRCRKYHRRRVR